jgi:uncharacterized integral membrane protein
MQWLSRALLLVVLLTAVVFGAVNGTIIELDFVWVKWNLPLGVALLGFLVLGALLGVAGAYLAFVPKLKAELKRRSDSAKAS